MTKLTARGEPYKLKKDGTPRAYKKRLPLKSDGEVVETLAGRGGVQAFSKVIEGEFLEKGEPAAKQGGKVGFGFGGSTPNVAANAKQAWKNKPWREALDRAIAQSDGQKLRKMADALIKRALQGDVPALKEIGDRLDGKAIQQVESKVEATVIISVQDSKL